MLHDDAPVVTSDSSDPWEAFEPNPWMDAVKRGQPDGNGTGTEDAHSLADFPAEGDKADGDKKQPADHETSAAALDLDSTAKTAPDPPQESDSSESEPPLAALMTTVTEASREVTTQLTAAVHEMRRAAAERHAADIAALERKHAAELEALKETLERDVADRVRQEETQRRSDAIRQLRDELEQHHAEELARVRAAVIDSFNGLTGELLEGLREHDSGAAPSSTGTAS